MTALLLLYQTNRNMMSKSIRTEIIINAPKEKVWNILADFPNYPEWNPFLVNIQGKLAESEILKNTMANGSKTFVFKPRVLTVVPGRYFDWRGSLFIRGLFDGHHYFEIEEIGPGQVKLNHGEDFSGILSGFLLKRIGDDTRNNFIRMNQAIKQRAERSCCEEKGRYFRA